MTTSRYLDSRLKILPAVQARNIADLLSQLQSEGQIKNASEYQAKLQELSTLINDTVPKPFFTQIRAKIWELISSDGHNIMMDTLKRDLLALYEQVEEIGNKINDHHFLMMKNLATDLERGLLEQESIIRQLEWISNNNNEFSLALINEFKSSTLFRSARSDLSAETLYFDNRTFQNVSENGHTR